jgi:hypothetical protein
MFVASGFFDAGAAARTRHVTGFDGPADSACASGIDWNYLPEPLQLALSRAALHRAAEIIARQAETLAGDMEAGSLQDRGGPEALRLLAAVIRTTRDEGLEACEPA